MDRAGHARCWGAHLAEKFSCGSQEGCIALLAEHADAVANVWQCSCCPTSEMWRGDFGVLPVVADGGKVVGLITDRDLCIAAATKHRDPARIRVSEVTSDKVYSCSPDSDIREALQVMEQRKVRRLPVISAESGELVGILSLNDLALKAREAKQPGLAAQDVEEVLSAICAHPALSLATQARRGLTQSVAA